MLSPSELASTIPQLRKALMVLGFHIHRTQGSRISPGCYWVTDKGGQLVLQTRDTEAFRRWAISQL